MTDSRFAFGRNWAKFMNVTVLAPDASGAQRDERWGDLDIERFVYFRPRSLQKLAYGAGMPDNLRGSWLARLQVPFFLWCQMRAIRRLIRERGFQWVNAHWVVPSGLAAAWACASLPNSQLAVHVHSSDLHLLRRIPFGGRIARYVVGRSQVVFASSTFVREKLDELLGFGSGATIQPMGVDVGLFRGEVSVSASHADRLGTQFRSGFVLFVGRLVPIKGLKHLVQALPKVLDRSPGLGLVVIGTGPEEALVREEVSRLGLDDAVEFAGSRPHNDVVQAMRDCRVVCVPSVVEPSGKTEGMPTVVVEAMAAGALVVASAVGGVSDVLVDGSNGWLCAPADSQDLAAKVLLALASSDRAAIQSAALETSARYDWRKIGERYVERLVEEPIESGAPSEGSVT